MRVHAYLHYYPPLRYVGGELASAEFFEHLVGAGHKVDVYAKFVTTPYTRNGVRVMNSGFLGPVVSQEYDLFVTHPEIRASAMRLIEKRDRVPYVAIVHNTSAETLRSLERQTPDLTIANSEWTASKIPTSVENVHVVRPLSFRREYGNQPGEYVTMINLSVEKGVGMFSELAQRHPLYHFIGVKGGYRTQAENLPPNVLVMEHSPNIEVAYRKTKVLLVPSLTEAYGMVVAEAMQYGIPVIASDLPGIREVGGDAPIYCAPEDYRAWSQSLDLLMGNPGEWALRSLASMERGMFLYERSRADLRTFISEMERLGDRCACGLVGGDDECQIPCGLSARTSPAPDGL